MVTSKTVLLLSANPIGTDALRLQEEEREIKERLRRAGYGKFVIHSTVAARTRDIQQALLDYKPHIVHFSGHGAGANGLVFEDVTGKAALVNSEALANLFKLFASRGVECVVLNACYSEAQALAIKKHIEYVVGMNQTIGDKAAIEFTVGFYTGISYGESYEFAFDLACNAIELANLPEYSTPVLLRKKHINNSKMSPKKVSIFKQRSAVINEEIIQDDLNNSSVIEDKIQPVSSGAISDLPKLILSSKLNNEYPVFDIPLNYEALNVALQASKWLEGNHETYKLFMALSGKQEGEYITEAEIKNISCEALQIIDNLWLINSNNRFGLSIQKLIYYNDKNKKSDIHLAEKMGWLKDGKWLNYDEFRESFAGHVPTGYLPICVDLQTCEKTKLKLELQWTRFIKVFFPAFMSRINFCGL
ncbi:GUN4 domain-containing protein [Nostoc sphaeroides]|uniref:CHAT domain-containing protein n=1 Tax=Nostoc sphaeroides CCNUC1 TaxID=2653204 RepID=A0A5P8W6W9_9NOSO|nr:GUN4 domain-containing protein [Nostoc sphaeroides]QFS47996.1 CHAT domain-containing protein [Nostoc sphaeroides CCNUC1]